MLDIFKWQCTINETCHGYFLWGNTAFYKKKKNIKLPLLKNLHFPTKKNRTASVSMLE